MVIGRDVGSGARWADVGRVCGWRVGVTIVVCGGGHRRVVVIGLDVPFRPVILARGFVFELPELAYLVFSAFEPLALVYRVLMCPHISLTVLSSSSPCSSSSTPSLLFPFSFGSIVWVSVVVEFGWGLVWGVAIGFDVVWVVMIGFGMARVRFVLVVAVVTITAVH